MIFYAGKVTLFHTFFISLLQKTENAINYEEKIYIIIAFALFSLQKQVHSNR